MWIDSHAHIMGDKLFDQFDEIKKNAINNNVKKILIICGNLIEIERAMKLVEKDTMFDLAIGVHPGSAHEIGEEEFNTMMTYLKHPQVVAVGEIGLDYYWSQDHTEIQKERFIQQIAIANKHNLPIIVHLRSSKEDILEILTNHPVDHHGVIHSYTEDVKSMKTLLDLGFYIGFGGILTFKNGENVQEAYKACPLDRVLSETDSPYLAPTPMRGKVNEPSFVVHTIDDMRKIKDQDEQEFATLLENNYKNLFTRTLL